MGCYTGAYGGQFQGRPQPGFNPAATQQYYENAAMFGRPGAGGYPSEAAYANGGYNPNTSEGGSFPPTSGYSAEGRQSGEAGYDAAQYQGQMVQGQSGGYYGQQGFNRQGVQYVANSSGGYSAVGYAMQQGYEGAK